MGWLTENWLWVAGCVLAIFLIYLFTRPGRPLGQGGRGAQKKKVTPQVIDSFFKRYGWRYNRDTPNFWRTGWKGAVASFPLLVRLDKHWIYFTVTPFVQRPRNPTCMVKVQNHLLRLNGAIPMAKFSVDSDGNVVLAVEMPCANLDYEEFADAVRVLCYISEENYREIRNLATNAGASSRYDNG